MLLQHVWDLHFDPSTNIIDVYVGRVRRKVDDARAYPLIHTIRGIGYCLRALAKTLRSSTFRLALIAIAAFGLIVAAIMAYVYFGTIAYVQSRVGDAGDHSGFTAMIELAMAAVAVLMLVLAGLAAVLVTRRTVGRIEEINATSRAIMMSGLDQRIPLRGSHDEWDGSPKTSTRCSTASRL